VIDWECAFKRKDGTAFFAILNTEVIEREGQKLNLTTMRDITERKVAEEKIKSQNVQLKKLDGVKTDFLNTTSHELRTPVASIKGYIQMLLKQTLGEITEEQKKALEVLLRNTNRLDHLIQDILDISRLESGTMKFITEKTDATKMIKEIAETMQVSADLKRIKINSDIQKGIPDLMIDQERIKQVLMNLVDNAIKFSPDGSMIQIKARKEKEDVVFEVQDFGRGIPKNKQKKIFERFYQVDSGIDRKFGGVGLGLTISKKIIDTYGGQIWVDSTLGKGSSFKFSVPLQSAKNIEGDLQEIMEWP
jgi:signal transduction histidine kinase